MNQYTPDMEQARTTAADWHGGQWTALYSFASAGHVDMDRLRDEVHGYWHQADDEQRRRLGALLRACEHQHIAQSRELARQLCQVTAPEPRMISHTEPGAMDADKARVTRDMERAQALEFGVYAGFLLTYGGQVLSTLASAYSHPDMACAALLRHSDQVLDRINSDKN